MDSKLSSETLPEIIRIVADHFIEGHELVGVEKALHNGDKGALDWHHTIIEALEDNFNFTDLLEDELEARITKNNSNASRK